MVMVGGRWWRWEVGGGKDRKGCYCIWVFWRHFLSKNVILEELTMHI